MPPLEPAPEAIIEVDRDGRITEDVVIRLEADLDEEVRFGRRILEVTRELVRTLDPAGAVSFQIPIIEVKSARNEPLVGGGRLEITTKSGEILPVISYSMTHAALFSEAARGIEQLARAEQLLINLKQERV